MNNTIFKPKSYLLLHLSSVSDPKHCTLIKNIWEILFFVGICLRNLTALDSAMNAKIYCSIVLIGRGQRICVMKLDTRFVAKVSFIIPSIQR